VKHILAAITYLALGVMWAVVVLALLARGA
jgi:hypothetical protein